MFFLLQFLDNLLMVYSLIDINLTMMICLGVPEGVHRVPAGVRGVPQGRRYQPHRDRAD